MKLVFYSGGDNLDNIELDKRLLELYPKPKSLQMTFIPSSSYMGELEFQDFVNHYRRFGVSKFLYFPVDIPFSEVTRKEVFKSDIIHLAGGNTYYFLRTLKQSKVFSELKKFVAKGGALTGLSAGAILMTPNISTAGFPAFDCDENEEGLTNFHSLKLVNFEFFPHYRNSKRYDKALAAYSESISHPLYACPDGAGIIVNGSQLCFINKSFGFFNGKKFRLNY
jgi:dipeptidase E